MYKIAFIVGHEKKSSGAIMVPPWNITEYEWNRVFVSDLKKEINELDSDIQIQIIYRDHVGIHGAYALVNAYKPNCSIEFHFNASQNPEAEGSETLYSNRFKESAILAQALQDAICESLERCGKDNRKIKLLHPHERGETNVHLSNSPSCLIEPFFGSSEKDCELILSQRQNLIEALGKKIIHYLKGDIHESN